VTNSTKLRKTAGEHARPGGACVLLATRGVANHSQTDTLPWMLPTTADQPTADPSQRRDDLLVRRPTVADGAAMWRLARDSRTLDLNASYAYLVWCRDFAATSVVATVDGEPAGFVTGYRRPEAPDTLMVWQVAVDERHRGRGLARRMLDGLVDGLDRPVTALETTITADNDASIALFSSFARGRGAKLVRAPLFEAASFPDGHDPELLFRISPLT
jgi:diaminobutyrate acetyltransferase